MYKDLIVIDGLQYCRWNREYFLFLKSSGITAVHVTLVYHEVARDVLSILAKWNNFFESNSDLIMPVMSTEDIILAKRQNKVGILFGAQNCSLLDDEIGLVEIMRKLGLMIMQLTYNNQSLLATGCYEKEDGGITRFGAQVISEMNRVGMIIDMSHSADKSTLQAIDLSSRPICISHANPKSAHAGTRNKSDEIIKALISRGGLLGFSLYPFHLPDYSNCTLRRFCEMIADTTAKFGAEHFAIGSDLCLNQPQSVLEWMRTGRWSRQMEYGEGSASNAGWPEPLPWFNHSKGMENIYNGLIEYGFSKGEARGIIGGNWFNFLERGLTTGKMKRGNTQT